MGVPTKCGRVGTEKELGKAGAVQCTSVEALALWKASAMEGKRGRQGRPCLASELNNIGRARERVTTHEGVESMVR